MLANNRDTFQQVRKLMIKLGANQKQLVDECQKFGECKLWAVQSWLNGRDCSRPGVLRTKTSVLQWYEANKLKSRASANEILVPSQLPTEASILEARPHCLACIVCPEA